MRLLQVNDVHTSDQPPRWRTDSYSEDIWAKLQHVREIAVQYSADAIVYTGDLFHVPAPTRVSHQLVQRWLVYLNSLPCDALVVPGNHDLSYGSVASLDRQPLGSLIHGSGLRNLAEEPYVHRDGTVVVGLAWDYNEDPQRAVRWSSAQPTVLVCHSAIATKKNPYYPTMDPTDLMAVLPGLHFILHGHLHAQEAPYKVPGTVGAWVVNPGALSRGSLPEGESRRVPMVALIDTHFKSDQPFRYVTVPHRPADEVFRMEAAAAEATENAALESLVDMLKSPIAAGVSRESLIAAVDELAPSPRVASRAKEFILAVL